MGVRREDEEAIYSLGCVSRTTKIAKTTVIRVIDEAGTEGTEAKSAEFDSISPGV